MDGFFHSMLAPAVPSTSLDATYLYSATLNTKGLNNGYRAGKPNALCPGTQ